MKSIMYILWALTGIALAMLMAKTQHWSVMAMTIEKPKKSMAMIIGGAFFRWALIFLILALAFSDSIIAVGIFFSVFMTSRTTLLVIWHHVLSMRQEKIMN